VIPPTPLRIRFSCGGELVVPAPIGADARGAASDTFALDPLPNGVFGLVLDSVVESLMVVVFPFHVDLVETCRSTLGLLAFVARLA
jgi:hypothetical protein